MKVDVMRLIRSLNRIGWLALLTALLTAASPSASAQASVLQLLSGSVADVKDGDTIVVEDRVGQFLTVRLNGVDSPELGQSYGREARSLLRKLLTGQSVQVEIVKMDRYGRYVGKVTLSDGTDAGQAMVRSGLAWWYQRYAQDQAPADRTAYEAAERDARSKCVAYGGTSDPSRRGSFGKPRARRGKRPLPTTCRLLKISANASVSLKRRRCDFTENCRGAVLRNAEASPSKLPGKQWRWVAHGTPTRRPSREPDVRLPCGYSPTDAAGRLEADVERPPSRAAAQISPSGSAGTASGRRDRARLRKGPLASSEQSATPQFGQDHLNLNLVASAFGSGLSRINTPCLLKSTGCS